MSFGVLAHNLIVLFERKLGWLKAVTLGRLCYRVFVTAGIISKPQGQTTIKIAVPPHERYWWRKFGTNCSRLIPTAMQSEPGPR